MELGAHDPDRSGNRWYVVRTHPHREQRARSQLDHQGFHTFLPVHQRTVRHARQFRTAVAAFFPQYLFVHLDIGHDPWWRINSTMGVSRLIMAGQVPNPVPSGVVESFQAICDQNGVLSRESRVRPGESVRITTGPFAGLVGTLAQLDGDRRVTVLLDILGNQTVIAVSPLRIGLVSA